MVQKGTRGYWGALRTGPSPGWGVREDPLEELTVQAALGRLSKAWLGEEGKGLHTGLRSIL